MFTYSLGGKIYDSPYSSLMTPGQSAGNYHVDLYNNAWRINDRSNAMITTYKNAYDDAYNAAIAAGQTTSRRTMPDIMRQTRLWTAMDVSIPTPIPRSII